MEPGCLELEWKSFLLFPQPEAWPDLETFKAYTGTWQQPGAEEPRAGFRQWMSEEGPPSHSVPPHLMSKAAERIDRGAWERLHWDLLEAYFQHSRDITSVPVLRSLWESAGLPAEGFEEVFETRRREELAEAILADYREAIEHGVSGVPALRLKGDSEIVMGAQPTAAYRLWVDRLEEAAPKLAVL